MRCFKNKKDKGLLLSGLMALMLCSMPVRAQEQVVKFGVYTSDRPTDVYDKFSGILEDLSAALSRRLRKPVKVDLIIGKDYQTTIRQLVQGQIDFARLGPASYVIAKQQEPGLHLLAMELEKGKKFFFGSIFVRQDSSITALSGLKGRSFAFGDKESTIGRFLSQKMLYENGITAKDLSKFDYLERHDRVCAAVLAGDFDAGAAKSETFQKYKDKDLGLKEIQKILNVTKPWVARSGLDPRLAAELTRYFLTLKDREVLKQFGVSGFSSCSEEDYQETREALKFGELFEQSK